MTHISSEQYNALLVKGAIKEPPPKRGNFEGVSIQTSMPPSVNNAYATVHGRRVLTREGRRFKESVSSMPELIKCRNTLPTWIAISIHLWLPLFYKNGKVRRFDASNRIKLLEDAVCEGLGIDDSRVIRLTVQKVDAKVEAVGVHIGVGLVEALK